jgi:hypothetical protein
MYNLEYYIRTDFYMPCTGEENNSLMHVSEHQMKEKKLKAAPAFKSLKGCIRVDDNASRLMMSTSPAVAM